MADYPPYKREGERERIIILHEYMYMWSTFDMHFVLIYRHCNYKYVHVYHVYGVLPLYPFHQVAHLKE